MHDINPYSRAKIKRQVSRHIPFIQFQGLQIAEGGYPHPPSVIAAKEFRCVFLLGRSGCKQNHFRCGSPVQGSV
ncbi:MAG TPA: hypothetical protein DD687_04415 [Verrucomicrobiales bacterium]|nr:hypothetical protein [Verrucomicrobiales bacterium]HBP55177.1 hypothetical protein [Verrucomicrobiales bacterium]